jgi:hypothetical protein
MNGMNGRGTWIAIGILATFLGGSFVFTLGMYFKGQESLAAAVEDRNTRLLALRTSVDNQWITFGGRMDQQFNIMMEIRDRLRALECAQGLPSCAFQKDHK